MTVNFALSPDNSDPGNLAVGVSQLTLSDTGEVEIAGHRYITAQRLASMLSVTERTLARWNAARIGPPKIAIGKTVLYDLSKLPAWLASREVHPTPKTRH
jgi:hypothetical protein